MNQIWVQDNLSRNRTRNEEKMSPLPKISAEESVSLTDLLSKIFRYEPEQRISLEDLVRRPWITAPAGVNHRTYPHTGVRP